MTADRPLTPAQAAFVFLPVVLAVAAFVLMTPLNDPDKLRPWVEWYDSGFNRFLLLGAVAAWPVTAFLLVLRFRRDAA